MQDNTPIAYDEQKSKDIEMQKINEDSKANDSRENEPIEEKEYISECQNCNRFLGMEVKSITYDEREKFGCGWRVIKLNNQFLCPHCLTAKLRELGYSELTLGGGIKMEKDLVVKEPIVMPAVSKEKAVEAFNAYQDLAKEIIRPEDIQKIQGKDFKKKSFWRKCQRFFNLSLEKIEEHREEHNGSFTYHFIFRAIAPNGTYVDGTGSCSSNEKGLVKTEHITRATAETRAKNRAIADLVAFGEVSAEEIIGEEIENREEPYVEKFITEPQRKRLFAITKQNGVPEDIVKSYMKEKWQVEHSTEITMGKMYEDICLFVENFNNPNKK